MSKPDFPGTVAGSGAVLCLEALDYARRVFGADDARWYETPVLLATGRQLLQSLRPQWLLFPLREWAAAWWQAREPGVPAAAKPLRALKARLADEGFRVALLDALRALHSVTGIATGLALQIDGPEQWLAWVGASDGDIDEADAEDVVVFLAALLHALAGSGIGAVLVRQVLATSSDPAERYAALTNAAGHHGWASVLCSDTPCALPEGFDALAVRTVQPGLGAWLGDADWGSDASITPPFIVARVPVQATPDAVLAQIARWRGNH